MHVGSTAFWVLAASVLCTPPPLAAEPSHHDTPHWSYAGPTDPSHWPSLGKEYGTCGLGGMQSPIDIRDENVQQAHLPRIDFRYKPVRLRIIDNGHTLQVNYGPGSFISVGGKRYELVQFHFHKPSEEKLNGKGYDMVAHMVHRAADGKLAVVAVLLEAGATESPLVRTLWEHLPNTKEIELVVPELMINAADLLPANRAYYTYTGSLTTPPCSEGVTWFVMRHPAGVSADQVARFGKLYPKNARPVQPQNGRAIRSGG